LSQRFTICTLFDIVKYFAALKTYTQFLVVARGTLFDNHENLCKTRAIFVAAVTTQPTTTIKLYQTSTHRSSSSRA
jgi:hypothetical protein